MRTPDSGLAARVAFDRNRCRLRLACCAAWRQSKSPFGRLILVSGPEGLLPIVPLQTLCQQMRSEAPDVEISEIEAARLDRASLSRSPVHRCSPAVAPPSSTSWRIWLRTWVQIWLTLPPRSCPILPSSLVHGGGAKGKALLEKLKSAGVEVIECAAVKTWELPQFVSAEVKRAGSSIDAGAAVGARGRGWSRPAGVGCGGHAADLGRARVVRSPSIRSVATSVAGLR